MELPRLPPRLLMAVAIGDLAFVKRFVETGDDVNETGEFGTTPLQTAIQTGRVDIVTYLLQKGANLPPANELPEIPNEAIRRVIDAYREWNPNARGFAEFSAAVQTPSLAMPGSPIEKLNRDVVGNIASFLRPSGTAPKGKTGRGRHIRKQTRRRR